MSRSPYGGAALAVVAMLCVQLGLAVSVGLVDRVGVTGAAWLRLAWAGVLFLVFVRPRRGAFTRRDIPACVALGGDRFWISVLFMAAIGRIPPGTASAVGNSPAFGCCRGPRGRGPRRFVWPALAAFGCCC